MGTDNAAQRHQDALRSLHPVFRWRVEAVLQDLTAAGWQCSHMLTPLSDCFLNDCTFALNALSLRARGACSASSNM